MDKTFTFTLDDALPVNPQNVFEIWRGDNIVFNFAFKSNGADLSVPAGTTLRIFAKKVGADSLVDKTAQPLFAGDFTTPTTASFNSSQTAGDAGNYLLTVMLMTSTDELITAQGIYFWLRENGYAGIYQPSPDYRDEVLDALAQAQAAATAAQEALAQGQALYNQGIQEGNAILADCNSAKTGAEAAQANAAQSETGAQQFKNAAETAAQNAATSEGLASSAQQQADAAKTAAQTAQAAAEAAAVAAQNTDLGRFGLIKQDGGTLYIGAGGGCFKNTTTTIGAIPARSMCITLKFDKDFSVADWDSNTQANIIGDLGYANGFYNGICLRMTTDGRLYLLGGRTVSGNVNLTLRNYFPTFFGGTSNQVIPAGTYALVMTVSMNEESTFSQIFVNSALKDSNTMTTINTANFNAGTGFDVCSQGNFHGTDFTKGCFSGQISRVMAFNFDMSATDAPYTIADYQSAKPIPPALCSTTATQRALVAFADYTIARNTATRLVKDISANGNDATITGDVNGDKDLLISTFVDELKTQIAQQSTTE